MNEEITLRKMQKDQVLRLASECAAAGDKRQAAYHLETAICILQAERDELQRDMARLQRLYEDFTGVTDAA